ncbi:hypothetical protein M5K25_017623 [Dendrobium thyrsiflorum]|uniref:SH3 domain-containing protein n=1 Tax=Dendrobium thyrsiflorum TaxID=117978 RepID=A0ABD0UMR8_DENTH
MDAIRKQTTRLREQVAKQQQIVLEHQRIEASPVPTRPPQLYEANDLISLSFPNGSTDSMEYFIAEVMHSHMAETDVELSLSVGDYVVVRKVSGNGWAEGECRG